jgi:hypothetical protein
MGQAQPNKNFTQPDLPRHDDFLYLIYHDFAKIYGPAQI